MGATAAGPQVVYLRAEDLRPHPRNEEFFTMAPGVYEELKADIAQRGVQQPLVVASDGRTILSGHLRHRAALELGLAEVPVMIRPELDPDAPESVVWMVLDNVVRRQVSPVEKARAVRLLKEQYGIKKGARTDLAGTSDIVSKVAAECDISPRQLNRYDRLNYLIPPLQRLVEEGALSLVAGVELSYLAPEVQERLAEDQEAALRGITAAGARELRRKLLRYSGFVGRLSREIADREAYIAKLKPGKRADELRKRLEALKAEREKHLSAIGDVLSGVVARLEEGEQRKKVRKDRALRACELAAALMKVLAEVGPVGEHAELRRALRRLRGMLQEMEL